MNVQDPYTKILNYIGTDEVKNLFTNSHSHKNNTSLTAMHYHRSESLLSVICDETVFGLIRRITLFDDHDAVKIMKKATYSGKIPFKFSIVETITLLLTFLPFAAMFFDFYYSWTDISAFFYLYTSACGLSLYITARVAKKEWMVHNWNEKEKKG